jgi:SAM-dependent methyltransferase
MAFADRKRLQLHLICPACSGRLSHQDERILCRDCEQRGCWVDGAAVFFSEDLPQDFYDPEYTSSNGYSRASLELIRRSEGGMVLDLGAGQASADFPNVVQMEIRKYRGTDVVLTHDRLPFEDNTFDGIISQAVIEHVRDPWQHVREIERTLKPGGQVVLDAAFMQPLHGAPYHYFNTTKYAVELLFEQFDIHALEVAPYQHPWYSLRWILQSYRRGLRSEEDRREFDGLTFAQLQQRFTQVDENRRQYRLSQKADPQKVADWGQNINQHQEPVLGSLVHLTKEAEVELAAGYRVIAAKKNEHRRRQADGSAEKETAASKTPAAGTDVSVDILRLAQPDESSHTGELFGDDPVTQTFHFPDSISRIDIMFATFMRQNTAEVLFRLFDRNDTTAALVERTVSAQALQDNRFYSFCFEPCHSKTGEWLIELRSPEATADNCVTVRSSGRKSLSDEVLRIHAQEVARDITFRVYARVIIRY